MIFEVDIFRSLLMQSVYFHFPLKNLANLGLSKINCSRIDLQTSVTGSSKSSSNSSLRSKIDVIIQTIVFVFLLNHFDFPTNTHISVAAYTELP